MKFKEYLEAANKVAKEHPECLKYDVYWERDIFVGLVEEVEYTPKIGVIMGKGGDYPVFSYEPEIADTVLIN